MIFRNFENCFLVETEEEHNAPKVIRFITSSYSELFRVRDGAMIRITYPNGEIADLTCVYLDSCHAKIGSNVYHICEFAERMEELGAVVAPI